MVIMIPMAFVDARLLFVKRVKLLKPQSNSVNLADFWPHLACLTQTYFKSYHINIILCNKVK